MTDQRHTPGPWYIVTCVEPSRAFYINASQRVTVAGISGASLHKDDATIAADARLIAAAPDLLRMCESAVPWLAKLVADMPEGVASQSACRMVLADCEAAIAKATGETP